MCECVCVCACARARARARVRVRVCVCVCVCVTFRIHNNIFPCSMHHDDQSGKTMMLHERAM